MPKPPKKDKFEDLPVGFKEAVEQSSEEEIRKRISNVAILDCETKAVLKSDPDVAQAKDALKELMDPYREDLRSYKLQIEWCKRVLDDRSGGAATTKTKQTEQAAAQRAAQA
jgi:hypothetical protein